MNCLEQKDLSFDVTRKLYQRNCKSNSRTKQMLRVKYWFPDNGTVEDTISSCYQCQITTVERKQEPVKPSEIPKTAMHALSAVLGGPHPDGHCNLVVTDKRTRYFFVEQTTSTTSRVTCDKLGTIFAIHGIPERLEIDNGSPFNSADIKHFLKKKASDTRVVPEHPRANGEAESFTKTAPNRTEERVRREQQGQDRITKNKEVEVIQEENEN
ncbi:uncharacterized protein K02A2.6-like [Mercenaria mercenaria]|uniref:uncharacterized protein K02A2.6-like n=1 Tax=Mercenaria mercenaria TaxID=6596 RepID=UPI00234F4918|nr:uncharacterized protein K02A2.6-like [Mercenaria mercenaria]